jgi:hypothetical protein
MNQKKSHPRKPNTSLKGVKYVMLTVGLTSILGFWGLFARQAAAAGAANQSSGGNSNTLNLQPSGSNINVLPRVPSLVPQGSQGSSQFGGLPSSFNQAPQSSFGLFSNGSNFGQFNQRSPFTITRSSR